MTPTRRGAAQTPSTARLTRATAPAIAQLSWCASIAAWYGGRGRGLRRCDQQHCILVVPWCSS